MRALIQPATFLACAFVGLALCFHAPQVHAGPAYVAHVGGAAFLLILGACALFRSLES